MGKLCFNPVAGIKLIESKTIETLKLLNCQGYSDFRETSQDLAPALIPEKTVDSCHDSTVAT
ncbi:hypothetical protein ACE1CC_04880 [Aerosakkonemataceae cyanobacterium BLCC-F46]|uniref:Uncharacterized protein n=2 Tax=Floridanema TaxID=3396149 RepID=A0ABV4X1M7_9CYAN